MGSFPIPGNRCDGDRWTETSRRARILAGCHETDVQVRLERALGTIRADAWGEPDLSSNPLRSVAEELGILYDEEPEVTGPAKLLELVEDSGWWQQAQTDLVDRFALRETVVSVEPDGAGGLNLRQVPPYCVEAVGLRRKPQTPIAVREHIQIGDKWYVIEQSIADPSKPYYRAVLEHGSAAGYTVDASQKVLNSPPMVGDAYPYRDAEGKPVLSYLVRHAQVGPYMWDPFRYRELVDITLNAAVMLTNFQNLIKNASWAQRYAIGVRPVGAGMNAEGTRSEVIADASTVAMLEPSDESGGMQGQVGQWQAPSDPEAVLRAILTYEARARGIAGLQVEVTKSNADIRSGYSLAVQREGVVKAQRKNLPTATRQDLHLLATCAAVANSANGTKFSTTMRDYAIRYPAVELDLDGMKPDAKAAPKTEPKPKPEPTNGAEDYGK